MISIVTVIFLLFRLYWDNCDDDDDDDDDDHDHDDCDDTDGVIDGGTIEILIFDSERWNSLRKQLRHYVNCLFVKTNKTRLASYVYQKNWDYLFNFHSTNFEISKGILGITYDE